MRAAPVPKDEELRLAALRRYDVLDSAAEQAYDDLSLLAKTICGTPIALISLVDEHRQWFKSKQGLSANETPRELAFCAHAILDDQVFEVPNALADERFSDNPLVTDAPAIRFYAGAPLVTHDGYRLGTLCAISDEPKRLTDQQREALQALSRQVMYLFELRLHNVELRQADDSKHRLFATVSHDLRAPFGVIQGCAERLHSRLDRLSHEQIVDVSERLLRASKSAFNQLDLLLEWAQTQMRAMTFSPEPVDLHKVVDEVMAALDPKLSGKAVKLNNAVANSITVNADPIMLRSVIHNLVTNGMKFTPCGGSVTVSTRCQGDAVTVRVADTGVGMSEQTLAKFIHDGALNSTRGTQDETGFGLGLILVREYLAYHDSRLIVTSAEGLGSEFRFTLEAAK